MSGLISCPFCGFVPDINDEDHYYPVGDIYEPMWSLNCYEPSGGCGASILGDSKEDCIKKWNKRASPWIKFDPEDKSTWPEESQDVVVYPDAEYCDYHNEAFFNKRTGKFEMCVFTGHEHEDVTHDYVSHWRKPIPNPTGERR